jgi:hypothetical protein
VSSKIDICANLLEGYNFVYRQPINCRKGGVGVYYKDIYESGITIREDLDLNPSEREGLENLWIEISNNEYKYVIAVIYKHPKHSVVQYFETLERNFEKISNEKKTFIMCGDINLDLLKIKNNHVKQYTELLFSWNVLPCITLPTRLILQPFI